MDDFHATMMARARFREAWIARHLGTKEGDEIWARYCREEFGECPAKAG